MVAMLAARTKKLKAVDPCDQFLGLIDKLVCYTSTVVGFSLCDEEVMLESNNYDC